MKKPITIIRTISNFRAISIRNRLRTAKSIQSLCKERLKRDAERPDVAPDIKNIFRGHWMKIDFHTACLSIPEKENKSFGMTRNFSSIKIHMKIFYVLIEMKWY